MISYTTTATQPPTWESGEESKGQEADIAEVRIDGDGRVWAIPPDGGRRRCLFQIDKDGWATYKFPSNKLYARIGRVATSTDAIVLILDNVSYI